MQEAARQVAEARDHAIALRLEKLEFPSAFAPDKVSPLHTKAGCERLSSAYNSCLRSIVVLQWPSPTQARLCLQAADDNNLCVHNRWKC